MARIVPDNPFAFPLSMEVSAESDPVGLDDFVWNKIGQPKGCGESTVGESLKITRDKEYLRSMCTKA